MPDGVVWLAVADIFSLMSRDEARHAGFLNKAMSDFNLALDLGFLTKNRQYTFFKPQFIFYATYLSEKVSIFLHYQRVSAGKPCRLELADPFVYFATIIDGCFHMAFW